MIISEYKIQRAVDKDSIAAINNAATNALSSNDMLSGAVNKNTMTKNISSESAQQGTPQSVAEMIVPQLHKQIKKGQKVPLTLPISKKLDICIGWNVNNSDCDIDVSAFLLGSTDKVIGDDWFVFYGQTDSPDGSLHFSAQSQLDREEITADLSKINASVKKIVFVLTIYDAVKKSVNFSMLKDAYIRILDCSTKQEIVSFRMDEYYSNVLSMMIGEVYIHNGVWKFNAIGNGIAKELDGLCELYGVNIN